MSNNLLVSYLVIYLLVFFFFDRMNMSDLPDTPFAQVMGIAFGITGFLLVLILVVYIIFFTKSRARYKKWFASTKLGQRY